MKYRFLIGAIMVMVGCAHHLKTGTSPHKNPVQPVDPFPLAGAPCVTGPKLESAILVPVAPLEVIKAVDEEGNLIRVAQMAVTAESLREFFDYVSRLAADRERARNGCITK